ARLAAPLPYALPHRSPVCFSASPATTAPPAGAARHHRRGQCPPRGRPQESSMHDKLSEFPLLHLQSAAAPRSWAFADKRTGHRTRTASRLRSHAAPIPQAERSEAFLQVRGRRSYGSLPPIQFIELMVHHASLPESRSHDSPIFPASVPWP